MYKKIISPILLVITALIWGSAFVAQRSGTELLEPFSFNGIRCMLGGVALLPVIGLFALYRKKKGIPAPGSKKMTLLGGILCGIAVFAASSFQQIGLMTTDAGKSGFITAMYIVIVPLIGIFLKRKQGPWIWISVAVAVCGMYLLTSGGSDSGFGVGELMLVLAALMFSVQILLVDRFAPQSDCLWISSLQFIVAGILSLPVMFIFEHPTVTAVSGAWFEIAYAGIMSCGVAYTLQIFGQKGTAPALASLIMSLESVFAAISGALLLGERMTATEVVGCVLIFAAILFSQLFPSYMDSRRNKNVQSESETDKI